MFGIFYNILLQGRNHARHLGSDVSRVYLMCGCLTLFIWFLYPICWGVSEGGNVIPPDSEAVFYGVLDFCAKPLFSLALIFGHWNIDPGRMGLKLRDYDEDPDYFGHRNAGQREKHERGVTDGHGVVDGHTGTATGTDAARTAV